MIIRRVDLRRVLDVNVVGVVNCIVAARPAMIRRAAGSNPQDVDGAEVIRRS